jgi:TRAP-type C4-dicarboxylate transport system permease small subunit
VLKVLGLLYSLGALLAAICVALTTVLVLAQVFGRMMGIVVPAVPEVAGFLLGATIFLALPATMRSGAQIRINLFVDRMPFPARFTLEVGYRIVGAAVVAYLAYNLVILAYDSWDFGDRSAGLVGIPVWIPQVAMVVGTILLCVRFLEEAYVLLRDRDISSPDPESI